jgi:hypothetical protein
MKLIIGAGLSGLIAAHAWPRAQVNEAAPEPRVAHRAVLRFRSDAVARLTGIEFKRVQVRKGLWVDGSFQPPTIRWANLYAQKILGAERLLSGERSIWRLDPVERYIAPDNFHEQLLEAVGDRVFFGAPVDPLDVPRGETVSTAPLSWMAAATGAWSELPEFHRAPIRVRRWRLRHADLYQTVYFPGFDTTVYRASITGNILIAEAATEITEYDEGSVAQAFGIDIDAAEPLGDIEQRYGKIEPIHDALRKAMLFELTHRFGIYSLGRFATWRNVLLDDVVNDIDMIKRLARSGAYTLHMEQTK